MCPSRSPPSGEWSGSSSVQPAQAPRLSHWSKYDTVGSTEPVRGDASVRGRRRNRDAGPTDDYSEEPGPPVNAAPAQPKGAYIPTPPHLFTCRLMACLLACTWACKVFTILPTCSGNIHLPGCRASGLLACAHAMSWQNTSRPAWGLLQMDSSCSLFFDRDHA